MSSDEPLVSIVTPSFNQATFLEATLRSVLDQDYPHLEYLVIDGGSTDGSLDILRRYENRLAQWTSEADRGQAEAINKGLRLARGEIVAWLNSDDLYLPGAVSQAVSALNASAAASMVYADGVLIDAHSRVLDWHRYRTYSALDLLCFEVLLQPTVFMRREALKAVGLLNESYELILDHELWVRLVTHGPIVHVPRFWAAERTHPEAKTMAAAARFSEEARKLIGGATDSATLGPLVASRRRRVEASLECFCARRMIDAGRHAQALRFFARGLVRSPVVALGFWYKMIQAAMGAAGLEGVYLWYRNTRRRLQHRGVTLEEALRARRLGGGLP